MSKILATLKINIDNIDYLFLEEETILYLFDDIWTQVPNKAHTKEVYQKILKQIRIEYGYYKSIDHFMTSIIPIKNRKESMKPYLGESKESFMGGGL